jgi:hypothetical protein
MPLNLWAKYQSKVFETKYHGKYLEPEGIKKYENLY